MLNGRVGRDMHMYSITLQPELDTPEIMRGYVETYGVQPGWLFLRASREDTELLRRRLGFVDPDPSWTPISRANRRRQVRQRRNRPLGCMPILRGPGGDSRQRAHRGHRQEAQILKSGSLKGQPAAAHGRLALKGTIPAARRFPQDRTRG